MVQNCPNWSKNPKSPKFVPNGLKSCQTFPNVSKWSKHNYTKPDQNRPKQTNNGSKWSPLVSNRPKWFQILQNGPNSFWVCLACIVVRVNEEYPILLKVFLSGSDQSCEDKKPQMKLWLINQREQTSVLCPVVKQIGSRVNNSQKGFSWFNIWISFD